MPFRINISTSHVTKDVQPLSRSQIAPAPALSADRRARIVMVVEDEFLIRSMIAEELREAGYHIIECGNADEALDVLGASTEPAMIFTDVRMPGSMDGVGLARIVARDFPGLLVVLTSAQPLPSGFVENRFVPKPYKPRQVVRLVDDLLKPDRDGRGVEPRDNHLQASHVANSRQIAGYGLAFSGGVKQCMPDLKIVLSEATERAGEEASELFRDDTGSARPASQPLLRRIRGMLARRKKSEREGQTAV